MMHSAKPKAADQPNKAGRKTISIPFGPYRLRLPVLFAGYRMGDVPTAGLRKFPWALTGTEALLINAYDFTKPKYKQVIENGWNLQRDLQFPDRPVLIDSGAYYFVRDNSVSVTPTQVLGIERKSQAHVGVVLDHPFSPEARNKSQRIARTLTNTMIMLRANSRVQSGLELMPVVHGHNRKSLVNCIERIQELSRRYSNSEVTRVGIGSVAPLAQRGDARRATDTIATVRDYLPNAHIHCFSMGSPLLMLLALYAGADSVDSQTWIVSAAFKYAQVPGGYAVRLARRGYDTSRAFRAAIKKLGTKLRELHTQESFSVKNWANGHLLALDSLSVCEDYAHSLTDLKSNENLHNRACHNLWVYNYEIERYRNAGASRTIERFLENRMVGTRYDTAFKLLKQRLAGR